ncbi:MAG: hypothetical protein WCJ58_04645 [bacterium]
MAYSHQSISEAIVAYKYKKEKLEADDFSDQVYNNFMKEKLLIPLKKLIFNSEAYKAYFASAVIIVIFSLYLIFVGLPVTRSENAFNHGLRFYEIGNQIQAKEWFQKSEQIWPNKDARQYLQKMNTSNN